MEKEIQIEEEIVEVQGAISKFWSNRNSNPEEIDAWLGDNIHPTMKEVAQNRKMLVKF